MASKFGGVPVEKEEIPISPRAQVSTPTPPPVTPKPRPRLEDIAARAQAGQLSPQQFAAFMELDRRNKAGTPQEVMGIGTSPYTPKRQPTTPREQAMAELAEETGFLETLGVGVGKGFMNLGRGVGLVEPAGEIEKEAMTALSEESPMTFGAGEIIGETAPFLPAAIATGGIASTPIRALATGAVGATEGGILASGRDSDVLTGAAVGGGIGLGAEILFPVLGKLGRKVFQRVKGTAPKGAMLTPDGLPTPELQSALDAEGMAFSDLKDDAVEFISGQKPGASPEQVATAARATSEGVPLTKGEVTKDYGQLATEQRLLESAEDTAAEPLRQFKLKQSEAIRTNLRENFNMDVGQEETGQLIQDALTGRKKLLRTQKNDLYETAAQQADDIGGLPLFTDTLADSVPDADMMEDLAITAPQAMKSLDGILTKYGMKDPTPEMVAAGFETTPLTIKNFERFRKTLNQIQRGDQTGAAGVAIGPIVKALDDELMDVENIVSGLGKAEQVAGIRDTLKGARKTVRQLKTEFSPQSVIGRVIDTKKDGVTQITEASKVYSKLTGAAAPVEETRRVVKSLLKSGEKGEQAVASLQASTMMDLLDAGFGTESRKISGERVFNPIAFKRRLGKIGDAKLKAIFSNNKTAMTKLKNIEAVASDLIPPSGAVPKGSASVLMDLADKIGLAAISAKVPGGALVLGGMRKLAQPIKTGIDVRRAVSGGPEVAQATQLFDRQFPGLAAALAIPATATASEE